jgi:DNA-binding transcriptional LysR family regulator
MSGLRSLSPRLTSPSDLEYFFETAQVLNFSRASERLGISQPTLSQAIRRIEYGLGEDVFVRHKKGVTLTPAGKQLFVNVRGLLESWNDVQTSSSSSMREVRGQFTIGCHVSVGLYMLSKFLPKVFQETQLEIKLVHDLSRKITERVISSEVDIGIVVNPIRHKDLIIQKLVTDEVAMWYSKSAHKDLIDTSGKAVIIYDSNLVQSQTLVRKADKQGFKFRSHLASSSLEVIANLTAAGAGIGILPTRVAELAPEKLIKLPSSPVYNDEVCLIVRSEGRSIAAIQYLMKQVRAHVT